MWRTKIVLRISQGAPKKCSTPVMVHTRKVQKPLKMALLAFSQSWHRFRYLFLGVKIYYRVKTGLSEQ
jgi:hypothetical protein